MSTAGPAATPAAAIPARRTLGKADRLVVLRDRLFITLLGLSPALTRRTAQRRIISEVLCGSVRPSIFMHDSIVQIQEMCSLNRGLVSRFGRRKRRRAEHVFRTRGDLTRAYPGRVLGARGANAPLRQAATASRTAATASGRGKLFR